MLKTTGLMASLGNNIATSCLDVIPNSLMASLIVGIPTNYKTFTAICHSLKLKFIHVITLFRVLATVK